MRVFLGIDGGGSTCRARAVDSAGRILGEGLAGAANIATDLEGSLRAVGQAAAEALGNVSSNDVIAVLGLAGANDRAAAAALTTRLPFARSLIVTDGCISARGALGATDGIVAAIGTGSIFILQERGQQREIGGKGLVLGDEASGAWMGRRLLSLALRADDGFRPMTPLLQKTLHDLGGAAGFIAFAARARPNDFAALAPLVTESDDPAAQAILDEAGAECLAAIAVLQGGRRLPVACLGGLAAVFEPVIARHWPIISPAGNALDGASALAREMG
jgi:glucosamine kinase